MILCPSDERLVQLLEERLDRRELADIERHLERCGQCQEALEELTRERFSFVEWQSGPDSAPDAGEDEGRRSFPAVEHTSTLISEFGPEPMPDDLPEVEGYELLNVLGRGGMGVVYRARQHGLERLVALKMIRGGSHAAPEHLARFRIEARALARLRHPNVVQIYDVGHADDLPYVALELLEGGSLESRVAATPQPERPSAELVVTLAGAIGAAHRAGVVHRDLKSANVLFTTDDTPKIADFGLAKRLDEEDGQTHSGQVMGSPSFMAPEQARGRGREVGPLADLYSLGAILYEMLTGRPPFKGSSAMETLYQVCNDDPLPPTRLRPGLSTDLETICLKCLDKDPRRRYESAEALAADLARFLAGSPILARRIGLRERAWKWARRQPAAATLAALAMASALGLAGAGLRAWQLDQAGAEAAALIKGRADRTLDDVMLALHDGNWESGLKKLEALSPEVAGNARLEEVRRKLADLKGQLEAGRDRQREVDKVRDDLRAFRSLRYAAQLFDTQILGFGQFGDFLAVREAARGALDKFKPEGDRRASASRSSPDALTPAERQEVQRGRQELLLILAEAVSRPIKGEDPARQADQALAILAKAPKADASTRSYHLLRADCLARRGDVRGADAERTIAESIPATDAFSHVLKGQDFHHRQKWPAAIAEFERALRIEPDSFRAQLLLAVCQLQVQRPDLAISNLNACVQRQPDSISLYLLRGFAYAEDGNAKLRTAQSVDPRRKSSPEAEPHFEAAEDDFERALGLHPATDERYALLVNRGALRFRRQRVDEAIRDFKDAVALRPDQVAAYIPLGMAYRQQGRTDAAIEQFTNGIRLRPEMAALYRNRGLARVDRPDRTRPSPEAIKDSLADLTEAIRLERPGSKESAADHARRARLLLLDSRPEEALADCDAAPDDPEAPTVRVRALLELKRYADVVGACDAALARGKPSAELYELRGLARSGREDFTGAIQDYTQALALDPRRPTSYIQRGWAYTVSDATKLALSDFEEAIRLNPDEPDAYNGRGFVRVAQGRHQEGVRDAEESLRRGPADARTPYNAARVYARAVASVTSGSARRNLGQVEVADRYQDRAQALIRLTMERIPTTRRGEFWRTVVQADPTLAPIRQRPKFSQMASQYGRQAK